MPAIRPLLIAACVVATLASLGGPRPPMLDAAPAAAAPPKTFALEGLHGPVTVRRDSYGIPHIQATDAHDLFMAFGFVQAGDRLWQMDATRRTAQGRLAELSGPRLLDLDKWFRTLGIPRVAREIVAEMDPETLAILQAFSDGVNAYLEQFPERTEGEFKFLSYRMDPWTPYDSACVMRMVSWWLSGDYDKELFAHLLEQNLGPDLTDAIFPLIPDARRRKAMRAHYPAADGDPAVEAAVAAERWTASVGSRPAPPAAPAFEIPAPTGSNPDNGTNIWVIHGSRTASGTPILANDPHLQLFAPSVWYEAQLTGGDFDVIGFTFPGMPIVAIGHNRHLAWGASNYPADSQDLFRVEVSADRRQYRTFPDRGSWQPLEITTEEILVRNTDPEQLAAGAPPMLSETLAVYHTAYGPLVRIEPDHTALALAWMGLTASQEIDVFLHAARAESVGELQRIFTGYGSPTQNFYAFDTAGRIGAIHAGKIPKRVRGERGIPVDSADPDAAWNGLVPYDSLGQVIDPPEGFLANANNKPVEAEEATGARFTPPLRYRRIQELLAARTDWTPDDARRMQTDTVNLAARDMVVALNALPLPATGSWSDPTAEGWYRRLLRWDANQRSDEPLTTVWYFFTYELAKDLIQPLIGQALWNRYQDHQDPQFILTMDYLTEGRILAPWLGADDDRIARVQRTFQRALERLRAELGPNEAEWYWSGLHELVLAHPSGMNAAGFGAGRLPHPGGRHTINVSNFSPSEGWHSTHGVSLRFVAYMEGNKIHGQAVLPPGEAGSPASPNFRNQLDLYRNGELRPMPFWPDELAPLRAAVELVPR